LTFACFPVVAYISQVGLEGWHPDVEFPIYICQIFVLKIINLGVIFFELNRQTQALAVQRLVRDNEDHDGGYYKDSDSVREEAEKLLCWETYIGIYVWKLVFSSMIVGVGVNMVAMPLV
jgi:hypothetical protein